MGLIWSPLHVFELHVIWNPYAAEFRLPWVSSRPSDYRTRGQLIRCLITLCTLALIAAGPTFDRRNSAFFCLMSDFATRMADRLQAHDVDPIDGATLCQSSQA